MEHTIPRREWTPVPTTLRTCPRCFYDITDNPTAPCPECGLVGAYPYRFIQVRRADAIASIFVLPLVFALAAILGLLVYAAIWNTNLYTSITLIMLYAALITLPTFGLVRAITTLPRLNRAWRRANAQPNERAKTRAARAGTIPAGRRRARNSITAILRTWQAPSTESAPPSTPRASCKPSAPHSRAWKPAK